jgi:hypothetical protein
MVLCNALPSFSSQARATLHELSKMMGMPGKPDGISGADVERYYRKGRIREIACYCEADVVNTYRLWPFYELFRGRLNEKEHEASERIRRSSRRRANRGRNRSFRVTRPSHSSSRFASGTDGASAISAITIRLRPSELDGRFMADPLQAVRARADTRSTTHQSGARDHSVPHESQ